jgi:hypothetical protein
MTSRTTTATPITAQIHIPPPVHPLIHLYDSSCPLCDSS